MRDGDELEPLRRAWEELEVPEPAPERSADVAERAALEWVRRTWERVEPPAPVRSPWPRPAPAAARTRRWPWIAAAAAAGLAGFWLATAPSREEPPGTAGSPEPAIARTELPAKGSGATEEHSTPPAEVELAHVAPDRMELRSGSVRLILLTQSAGPAAARSEDG
jgi:hypothetical protein